MAEKKAADFWQSAVFEIKSEHLLSVIAFWNHDGSCRYSIHMNFFWKYTY